jgi:hypothetical protein
MVFQCFFFSALGVFQSGILFGITKLELDLEATFIPKPDAFGLNVVSMQMNTFAVKDQIMVLSIGRFVLLAIALKTQIRIPTAKAQEKKHVM